MRYRRHSAALEDENQIDLTPMLDVVFIMLIFFIVTTSFVKESGITVNQPSAETTAKQEGNNILIAISVNGEVWIDKQMVDVYALRGHVERLRAESPEAAVIIQADEQARSGLLVEAMDQVRLSGIENYAIAAKKR